MWTELDKQWLKENREAIENNRSLIFELASDDNFKFSLIDGLYQKLSIAIANVEALIPNIQVSPDNEKEYMVYFYLEKYAIYTFPIDPDLDVMPQIKEFFSRFTSIPEKVYLPVIKRASIKIAQVR